MANGTDTELERTPLIPTILISELTERKSRNPLYSLRAFARDLGISSTCLSDVIAKKRRLSPKNAQKLTDQLSLSPEQIKKVCFEVSHRGNDSFDSPKYLRIEEDTFRMIADWYHYGILSLAKLKNNRADTKWVAKRLGISNVEAKAALERLLRLKFIAIKNARLIRTVKPIHCGNGFPSAVLRKHQKQNLRLAEASLDRDAFKLRENTSMTMAIDPAQLPLARKMIARFKDRMSRVLEKGHPKEIYTLLIHLFPLTRKGAKK